MDKEVKRRVQTELSELSERIGKLKIFVKSSKFKEIDKAQQPLLKKQLKVMLTYEDILKKRLN
ncbi:crAss001_48 related protein [Capnocytophaga canis]|uniref:50S ribosomal protein L29 n=1 Tax=Capnocytophaga canimorsus TaxID=28188 RepID=A0A0B7IC62_9FLAO|nr:hypothetical protein [Capnocytophaga canimorsus]CEN49330.1 conserved hypothetical protein [Capnocytophaga canimorsus]